MDLLKRIWKEEEGQGLVEYGLIVLLMVIIAAAVIAVFGEEITALFNNIGGEIDAAQSGVK